MNIMTVGISPEYNFPGSLDKWKEDNTYFASNHGASLITRAIVKIFNADYISDFTNHSKLNERYDACVLAFSTHIHEKRNVWKYTNLIEKLDMPVFLVSMGIQDYDESITSITSLHPSIERLLNIVSDRSKYIGVRGHYSASVLYKLGYKNVVPVGCPTLQWNLKNDLEIQKKKTLENPLVVYHKTMADPCKHLLRDIDILGQDYQDQVIFTDKKDQNEKIYRNEKHYYDRLKNSEEIRKLINQNGYFPFNFEDWFNFINKHDFVLGPRIHGSFASLIQRIPVVLIKRDLRVQELAEFYKIPNTTYEALNQMSIREVFEKADYNEFNKTIKRRFSNYKHFLDENKLEHELIDASGKDEFIYNSTDIMSSQYILNSQLARLEERVDSQLEAKVKNFFTHSIKRKVAKIPFAKRVYKMMR